MKFAVFFAVFVALAFAFDFPEEWVAWKATYGKSYDSETTELRRHAIWQANKKYVDEHNEHLADLLGFTVGLNEYSDLDSAEFAKLFTGLPKSYKPSRSNKTYVPTGNIPKSVDWRTKGVVTPIKNQGACGSCWAFSTTGSLEGQHAINTGKLVSLSEQDLVDCSGSEGNEGCDGGWPSWSFEYIAKIGGIDTEASYKYVGTDERCRFKKNNVGATCTGYVQTKPTDEMALADAIDKIGPISVCIDASHSSFQMYSSGVYYEPSCSSVELDHCVLAVGYGVDADKDMYIVKNSWGTSWGMQGYIYMSRNHDNNCGIATNATYPIGVQ